jgi:hypothetical protein
MGEEVILEIELKIANSHLGAKEGLTNLHSNSGLTSIDYQMASL